MKWKRSKKAQHDSKKEPHEEKKKETVEDKPALPEVTAVKPPLLDRERIIALERERAVAAANFNSNLENRRMLENGGRPMDMFRPYVV